MCQCASSGPTDGRVISSMCLIGAPPIYRPMARRCAPQADKSAMCTINDSVGKFCKHVRTSPFSERRTEHYDKNLHMQRKRAPILTPPPCLILLPFPFTPLLY